MNANASSFLSCPTFPNKNCDVLVIFAVVPKENVKGIPSVSASGNETDAAVCFAILLKSKSTPESDTTVSKSVPFRC